MSRLKLTITICAEALIIAAFASIPASAVTAGWMVKGAALTGTKALASTAAVDENWLLKSAGVTISCNGSTVNGIGPEIQAPHGGMTTKIELNGCSANENCAVTQTIGTTPLAIEFTLDGTSAALATFLPKTKTSLATIEMKGEQCAVLGVQNVTGKVHALLPTGQEEGTLQRVKVNVPESSGEVKVGSSAGEIKGSALPQLATHEPWSFL
jgi:hypothetical protein